MAGLPDDLRSLAAKFDVNSGTYAHLHTWADDQARDQRKRAGEQT